MKRLHLLVAVLVIALSSCQFFGPQKEVVKTNSKNADGTFIKKRHFNDDPYSPVEWEISMKFKEGSKSAIRHGVSKRFSKSGKLLETIPYKDNKKDGTRLTYHSTGKVYKEQPYVDGRLNGICKRYDREGRITAEYEYKNGLPGVGLKRYTNLGKQRPDPSIKITKTDNIRTSSTYIIGLSLQGEGTKSIKSVEFYEGQLIEGKFYHKNLSPAKKLSSKKGEIRIKLASGSSVNKTLNIIAVCKTSDGLSLIMQKPVKVDARGI
ncbi:toxin-antitoxin system YwqK family antitoxin [Carboxylicivirga sp. RSCT41]|uniref:toxin-antitoxin system YwqK family antitoxin n=1 Tax=Carboxylicivirga agarovorans TaxID=3417570 RepID=UPI003D353DD2